MSEEYFELSIQFIAIVSIIFDYVVMLNLFLTIEVDWW